MALYANVATLDNTQVRKATSGSLFIAPYSAPAISASTLFATDGSLKAPLPTGYIDGGLTTEDGVKFARSTDTDTITAWQSLDPVREDLTKDQETAVVTFIETNATTIGLYTGIDTSSLTATNGAITITKPQIPPARYLRLLCLAVDVVNGAEFYIARHYPRVKVTDWADQAFQKTGALEWGVTLTAYTDPVLKASKLDMIGGPGFASLSTAMGFGTITTGGSGS